MPDAFEHLEVGLHIVDALGGYPRLHGLGNAGAPSRFLGYQDRRSSHFEISHRISGGIFDGEFLLLFALVEARGEPRKQWRTASWSSVGEELEDGWRGTSRTTGIGPSAVGPRAAGCSIIRGTS
jgi:hypothetical protein